MKRRTFIGTVAASSTAAALNEGPLLAMQAPTPKPTRITLLGTGTPAPSLQRAGSGYLVEVGNDRIVMDHGPDAHHRLLESGRRAVDITHVLFTHLHYDHCMDYGRLVLQRWDQGADKIPELEVCGPPPIARMTEQLFGQEGVYGPDIRARIEHASSIDVFRARGGTVPRKRPAPRVREVQPGDVIQGNGWKVRVGRATHVQPFLDCLAFRLDAADGSVCYTGDSGMSGPLLTRTLLVSALTRGGTRNNGPRLVARDKSTGREIASVDLPGIAIGTPMTYFLDGKQYIALTVMATPIPELVAFALP